MANVRDLLKAIVQIPGTLGAALVDRETGICLAQIAGRSLDFDTQMDHYAKIVRIKERLIQQLELDDVIEELVFTSRLQYHMIYPMKVKILKVRKPENLFFFVALARSDSLFAHARIKIKDVVEEFAI